MSDNGRNPNVLNTMKNMWLPYHNVC